MFPKHGPVELCCKIIEMVGDWPIGLEEAEKIGMGFWQEREGFRERHTKAITVWGMGLWRL